MNIITKRNGIALIAVLTILLVLTLLLPLMFNMSETAMEAAMTGTDEQRSSYLARTMIEFTVGAFQGVYDDAEEDESLGYSIPEDSSKITDELKGTALYKLDQFLNVSKSMDVSVMYMYRNVNIDYPEGVEAPIQESGESDADYRKRCLVEYKEYMERGVIYSTTVPAGYTQAQAASGDIPEGTVSEIICINKDGEEFTATGEYVGYAKCAVTYDDSIDYFKTWFDPTTGIWETEIITDANAEAQYEAYLEKAKAALSANNELSKTEPQIFKVENRNVEFVSSAFVNGKGAQRRCILVLPTKPAESNWIVPANIESNQIFPDTSQCSGVTALSMKNNSYFIDEEAVQGQPVYGFSCVGNMVISTKNIKYKATAGDFLGLADGETMDYNDYIIAYNEKVDEHNKTIEEHNAAVQTNIDNGVENPGTFRNDWQTPISSNFADFSLGLHPETTTLNPERDPNFNCLKTNNMRTWASSAQRDNFVAFTATNGIQFDMPVNIIMNPCRTGRIGDGIARNKSLYKILYLQAPTIVFNEKVNSFISLYTKTSLLSLVFDYNAYRMSTIILAAPESTPYTMEIEKGGAVETVKAGKVYFAEDAYVWLIPFTENGSNYRTQTVYYKGKDIILYKFANAGDVFLFNAEKETLVNGEYQKAGFSMTSYFMDVIYSKDSTDTNNLKWWQLWSGIQSLLFDAAVSGAREKTYEAQDLQWIGNMNTGTQGAPNVDDFYVIWES